MPQGLSQTLKTGLTANRIVFIYFAVGSAWIVLSSFLLSGQASDADAIIAVEAVKGLGYILVTTVLLWILCRSWSRQAFKPDMPGVGSCFRFRCTLKTVELEAISEKTPLRGDHETSSTDRTLLVEDNLSNAHVAQTMLERLGLEVDLEQR